MAPARPGATTNVSVSLPSDLLSAVRDRAGKRGLSAYVAEAVRHQLEMDGLAEIVADFESSREPLTDAEVEAAAEEMFGHGASHGAQGAA
ncbi:hypothetical protein [Nocardia rhizosphaerihabitans]|uniref:CopG family transcriptional regulator n=1 Tax=Nocardia rhizosphaerihabitans TaxID=1691570 RepID=A0ABQ2KLF8_9NOCA|nr:hypothetical protein [Nocardia rhizosphaerihabitans]GGN85567.1 hypothetical protein GCM10011610_40080 [Nocardia rhizosphaerihabitans]